MPDFAVTLPLKRLATAWARSISHREEFVLHPHAERGVEHGDLVAHRAPRGSLAEPVVQVLADALPGDAERTRIGVEEPLEVVERLLRTPERAGRRHTSAGTPGPGLS